MILGFKQYFPWNGEDGKPEPTYFKEKITERFFEDQPNPIVFVPKIHTFREDPHDRWKAGMKVSMVYRGAGYKIIDWFNEGIPELGTIKSIQKIDITYYRIHTKDFPLFFGREKSLTPNPLDFLESNVISIKVDGKETGNYREIVRNDGFYDINQFKKWFKKDWSGKILHFTDFRYE
jgi:hypothetical protein